MGVESSKNQKKKKKKKKGTWYMIYDQVTLYDIMPPPERLGGYGD